MRGLFAALCATLGFTALSSPAQAFHTVDTFSEQASVGGGGGIYYTGSPRFRRWDCSACHINAPGELLLNLSSEPPELLTQGTYVPETVYTITVGFRNESRGLESRANYNSFALEILDGQVEPVGGFFNYDENLLRVTPSGDTIIARGQKNLDINSWTFQWGAPAAGRGYVDLHVAAVDGDGAGSATMEQGDPLNDDVVTGVLRLAEMGQPAPPLREPTGVSSGCAAVPMQDGLLMLLLPACLILRRRR